MTQPYCKTCDCGQWATGPICDCGDCPDCCTCGFDECGCAACDYRRDNYDASAEDHALCEAENDST